jgi:hypothetical protein
MGTKKPTTFDVECPCCRATLTVDPQFKTVLAHTPPPRTGPVSTLDKAVETVRGAGARRDAMFRQATEAEKNRADVLARKFDIGLQRAKDSPDPPLRRYDFD